MRPTLPVPPGLNKSQPSVSWLPASPSLYRPSRSAYCQLKRTSPAVPPCTSTRASTPPRTSTPHFPAASSFPRTRKSAIAMPTELRVCCIAANNVVLDLKLPCRITVTTHPHYVNPPRKRSLRQARPLPKCRVGEPV